MSLVSSALKKIEETAVTKGCNQGEKTVTKGRNQDMTECNNVTKAPETEAELLAYRQAEQEEEARKLANKYRVENLAAAIYARLIASDELAKVFSQDGQVDNGRIQAFINVCTDVAVHAAAIHAQRVWGYNVNVEVQQSPPQQPAQAVAPQ